ncbi:hypothetical protein ABZ379_38500 [Streptomyces canus]|uniref:hypothetical protein n=1 Tax=Streptomyces canus TaxID=58343 RepID=UPI0033C1F343
MQQLFDDGVIMMAGVFSADFVQTDVAHEVFGVRSVSVQTKLLLAFRCIWREPQHPAKLGIAFLS